MRAVPYPSHRKGAEPSAEEKMLVAITNAAYRQASVEHEIDYHFKAAKRIKAESGRDAMRQRLADAMLEVGADGLAEEKFEVLVQIAMNFSQNIETHQRAIVETLYGGRR